MLKSFMETPFVHEITINQATKPVLTIPGPRSIVDKAVGTEEFPFSFFAPVGPLSFVRVFRVPIGPGAVVLAVLPAAFIPVPTA